MFSHFENYRENRTFKNNCHPKNQTHVFYTIYKYIGNKHREVINRTHNIQHKSACILSIFIRNSNLKTVNVIE